MKTARIVTLPLLALLALTIYILACASFSPDDKKILYPTLDDSGNIGIAVYERDAGRNELLYVPTSLRAGGTNVSEPVLLRAQWLPDGKNILIASVEEGRREELGLTVVPAGGRGTVRSFRVPEVQEPGLSLVVAPCLSGDGVILRVAGNRLAKMNLRTGDCESADTTPETIRELSLYPAATARGAFYVQQLTNNNVVFGRVGPARLTLTPLMTISNRMMDGSFFTYDATGERVAFVEEDGDACSCVLLEKGTTRFTRKLAPLSQKLHFGNGILSPKADRVWASFGREAGSGKTSYGVMEIPLSDAPLKEKVLVPDLRGEDRERVFYFQMGISHDGTSAAVASTYLACAQETFRPDDCALFLLDLRKPEWKVTKVPIALPSHRVNPVK